MGSGSKLDFLVGVGTSTDSGILNSQMPVTHLCSAERGRGSGLVAPDRCGVVVASDGVPQSCNHRPLHGSGFTSINTLHDSSSTVPLPSEVVPQWRQQVMFAVMKTWLVHCVVASEYCGGKVMTGGSC